MCSNTSSIAWFPGGVNHPDARRRRWLRALLLGRLRAERFMRDCVLYDSEVER